MQFLWVESVDKFLAAERGSIVQIEVYRCATLVAWALLSVISELNDAVHLARAS